MAYTDLADMLADLDKSKTLLDQYNSSAAAKEKVWDEYKLTAAEKDMLRDPKTTVDTIKDYLCKGYLSAQMINHW